MLVKSVNLLENRFKNCRSANFSNEYTSFCSVGMSPQVARHGDISLLFSYRKPPRKSNGAHVSLAPDSTPKNGKNNDKGGVHEVTEEEARRILDDGKEYPGDEEYVPEREFSWLDPDA